MSSNPYTDNLRRTGVSSVDSYDTGRRRWLKKKPYFDPSASAGNTTQKLYESESDSYYSSDLDSAEENSDSEATISDASLFPADRGDGDSSTDEEEGDEGEGEKSESQPEQTNSKREETQNTKGQNDYDDDDYDDDEDDDDDGDNGRPKKPPRLIYLNEFERNNALTNYTSNYVSTTKYKVWNFLFKNLWEQFHRVANVYFLIIALITMTPVSPIAPGAFVMALVTVLGATAIKEAIEDWKRYISDKRVNSRACAVLRGGQCRLNERGEAEPLAMEQIGWERVEWKDIRVGDIVRIRDWQPFPADLLLLSSSNPGGICYIETANLDGETNLKIRQAPKETMNAHSTNQLLSLKGAVECEQPNEHLYKFEGSLTVNVNGEKKTVPLDTAQLLLRGSILRNTDHIYGLVLYTGHESKYMLNTTEPPYKFSRLEKFMNKLILLVLAVEIFLVLVSAIVGGIWQEVQGEDMWYLGDSGEPFWDIISNMFTFVVLYSPMVPISLYVSIEFVRVAQAMLINNDLQMYNWETDTPALARTSNLNEELGQVEYIFSDKTGTLTCNQMVFRCFSAGGAQYGKIPLLCQSTVHPTTNKPSPLKTVRSLKNETQSSSSSQPVSSFSPLYPLSEGHEGEDAEREEKQKKSYKGTPFDKRTDRGGDFDDADQIEMQPLPSHSNTTTSESEQTDDDTYDSESDLSEWEEETFEPRIQSPDVDFEDNKLFEHLEDEDSLSFAHSSDLREFLTILAVCHTVIPEVLSEPSEQGGYTSANDEFEEIGLSPSLQKNIRYQAASPDESALVSAAKQFGFFFHERTHNSVTVNILGVDETFEILNVLQFTSSRRRMSVIVRTSDGQIKLFCKGADSVIFERLLPFHEQTTHRQDATRITRKHIDEFASAGLRTLCVARTTLDPFAYAQWNALYRKASVALVNRDAKLAHVAEQIETNLELIGATGIEDRLQDGVPETIDTLMVAGLKIWVLTGDKRETAVNVAKACNLLKKNMSVLTLKTETKASTKKELDRMLRFVQENKLNTGTGNVYYKSAIIDDSLDDVPKEMERAQGSTSPRKPWNFMHMNEEEELEHNDGAHDKDEEEAGSERKFALVAEGHSLVYALEPDVKERLLALAKHCHTVICCRATPLQKTLVVKLIREKTKATTLAIGDGANDVSMIQAAHVGVGISGREGMQAVMASDYAIAQFRFLKRLLLVHGRNSYKRISLIVLYFFYKNILIALLNLWCAFFTGFSGQTVWDSYSGIGYNLVFTALPILFAATIEQDVPIIALERYPRLYSDGPRKIALNTGVFLRWCFSAVFASLLCFAIPFLAFDTPRANGQDFGIWELNTAIYTCCILVANFKLVVETSTWTWITHVVMWTTIASWFVAGAIYSSYMFLWLSPHIYWTQFVLYESLVFWLSCILVVFLSLLPDVVYNYIMRNYYPENYQIVQEVFQQENSKKSKLFSRAAPVYVNGG